VFDRYKELRRKVSFKRGVVVRYLQDHNFTSTGIDPVPDDIKFSVFSFKSGGSVSYVLKAYGYGYLSGEDYEGEYDAGAYGNGCIFLRSEEYKKLINK